MSKEKPPLPPQDETERSEKMRLYRQRCWQRFRQTRRRVQGTLTKEQYAEIERRAEEAGRAVWTQIHAEAEAYAKGEYLPPKEIEQRISELIMQFRRVGNNINQIARTLNTSGDFDPPDFVQNLEALETLIRDFVKTPWVEPPNSDDEQS